jgi:cytochrome b pre-mRNA-processing protein 3
MLKQLFRPRPSKAIAERLYAAAVTQARTPAFYTDLGVADRIDARFELYVIHVVLLVQRLNDQGEQAQETSQALWDVFVSALDNSLRELAVGDITVPKKMRKLAQALYSRAKGLREALEPGAAPQLLPTLLAGPVFGDAAAVQQAAPLADYIIRARDSLAAQPLNTLLEGRPQWPEPNP